MLTLRVQSKSGQPPGQALSANFTAAGGRIGRATGNDLVLDDPGKTISRVHASIVYRDGRYFFADMGSNSSMINDRVLGIGKEVELSGGDRIRIGEYVLEALIDDETRVSKPPAVPPLAPAAPAFAGVMRPEAVLPLPDIEPTPPSPNVLAEARILEDGEVSADARDELGLGLFNQASNETSHATERDDVPPEKQALSHYGLAGFPPMSSKQNVAEFGATALNREAMTTFRTEESQETRAERQSYSEYPGRYAAIPPEYDPAKDNGHYRGMLAQSSGSPQATMEYAGSAVTVTYLRTPAAVEKSLAPRPSPKVQASPQAGKPRENPPEVGSDSEVLRALLRGMGLPDLDLKKPPVEAAEQIGAMLREATSGTMEALLARTVTKQEMRIGMTIIAQRENNPLKLFPDARGALSQLITEALPGYMSPVKAYASAFEDLSTHEMAVMAGMQSALSSVLARFDPSKIEHGMNEAGMLGKLLPAHRKAKMWDRMVELYREVSREADHDFQRFFGDQFAQAYEQQIRALHNSKKK